MQLQHKTRRNLAFISLFLCSTVLSSGIGSSWYTLSSWITKHKTLSVGVTITTVIVIGLAYMQLKSLPPQQSRRSIDQTETTNTTSGPTALERIGESLLLTALGAIIHNKLTNNHFNSYIGSRIKDVVLQYDSEQLASLHETYLGEFSEDEKELLEDFKIENFKKGQGILLYGPPGTGKTLFVREFARRSNSTLLLVPSSRVNTGYAGDGAEVIAKAFEQARALASQRQHVVLFFEEIDGLGNRERETNSAADQSQISTINQFLFEMNSMPKEVITFGASNKIENLDRGAKRFGRFDKKIEKGLPAKKERYLFLFDQQTEYPSLHAFNTQLIANNTDKFSYADLTELCNRLHKAHAKNGRSSPEFTLTVLDQLKKEKEQSELKSKQEEREERERKHLEISKENLAYAKVNRFDPRYWASWGWDVLSGNN